MGAATRPDGPPWRILHVGDITPIKDQLTLLHAIRHAVHRISELQLDWVGYDSLKGRMQRTAGQMGLADRVRFHGFLPTEQLVPLYQGAHLHVQSSLHESQGVALLEAGAAGVPTVGTAVGLLPELAPAAAAAVPVANAAALGQEIVALLTNRERRAKLGDAARVWARAHDAAWTAARFEEIYRELIGRRAAF
jgi:glycosyltransferase involved in cell wall biosynthesis